MIYNGSVAFINRQSGNLSHVYHLSVSGSGIEQKFGIYITYYKWSNTLLDKLAEPPLLAGPIDWNTFVRSYRTDNNSDKYLVEYRHVDKREIKEYKFKAWHLHS